MLTFTKYLILLLIKAMDYDNSINSIVILLEKIEILINNNS